MVDILIAVAIVFLAWIVFKSLVAVFIALACVALAVYIVRSMGIYPRRNNRV